MTTAAIYARISFDRQDGAGVERQLEDCRALAVGRGWEMAEYVDNDVSAFRKMRRPAWDRLVDDVAGGVVDVVVAYHPDRLYRRLHDLEDLIGAIEGGGVQVATTKAGDVDLSTASGRLNARLLVAVARHESERIAERVSRAAEQRASRGLPSGGGRRPFGLTADRLTIVDAEADLIVDLADRLLAGASFGGEARRLNDLGVTTSQGGPWKPQSLRKMLTSAYVAGFREYKGEVVADTVTPPILSRDVWALLRARAAERRVGGRPPSDRYLLTGLIRCGGCGRRMQGNAATKVDRTYICHQSGGPNGLGCGRGIRAQRLEGLVAEKVLEFMDAPELEAVATRARLTVVPATDVDGELAELERRRNAHAARWGLGEIDDDEYEAARGPLTDRIDTLRARLAPSVRQPFDPAALRAYRAAWPEATVAERRAIVEAVLATPLVVGPGRTVDRKVVPVEDRVSITKRWADPES